GEVVGRRPGDPLARPEDGVPRGPAELHGLGEPGRHEVVVADDRGRAAGAEEIDAYVRLRVVADDIAEADEVIHALGVDRREHGGQRLLVGVDVREDRDPHARSLRATRRPFRWTNWARSTKSGSASSQAKTS